MEGEMEANADHDGHRVTHRHRLHWFERTLAVLTTLSAVGIMLLEVGRSLVLWP
jgi:hypothetical protein